MNLFKTTWMRLNLTRLINLKMKLSFNKIKMLRLCSDLPLMINHWKDLKYYIINMKVDKACRAIDNAMKKNYFLNKIWLKFYRDSSKFNFVLTLLKTHKNKTIPIVSHFSEMLMCVKRVSRVTILAGWLYQGALEQPDWLISWTFEECSGNSDWLSTEGTAEDISPNQKADFLFINKPRSLYLAS